MSLYDATVILGSQPDPDTWEFPSHIPAALDAAYDLWKSGEVPAIILSGRWAIAFDRAGVVPTHIECNMMADYLIGRGVPKSAIFTEDQSKDTLSNFFYIKRLVTEPNNFRRLLFIAAEFRLARIQFLADKILGADYVNQVRDVACLESEVNPLENFAFSKTRDFLSDMHDGDESFFEGKFFDDPYYHDGWDKSTRPQRTDSEGN